MSLERGGKADKDGNRYEYEWILYNVLDVINNDIQSFIWEPIGIDADGVDVIVKTNHNDYQQCKASNGDRDHWRLSDLMSHKILDRWKSRLSENEDNEVSLVSPISFRGLTDLILRARNSNNFGRDFYTCQIEGAGQNTKKLFEDIFKIFIGELTKADEEDYNRILSFLKRMNIKTYSYEALHNLNIVRIENLFLKNREEVYSCLLKAILDQGNYSHEIDSNIIKTWLELNNLQLRNLIADGQTIGKVMAMNDRFKDKFLFWDQGFISRTCYHNFYEKLDDAIITIIHGDAGVGKSCAIYGLIQVFEQHNRPYIAISVDNCVPEKSIDTWSKEKLDLPINFVNVINQLFKNDSPVIILDQFDTMRWRAINYSEAYSICKAIIKQVEDINKERKIHPIRVVIVTRTYDLEHNEFMKTIYKLENVSTYEVPKLANEELLTIIGADFYNLNNRTKLLLSRFINLYIWQQIKSNQDINKRNFQSQSHMINIWFNQVKQNIQDRIKCSDKEIESCNQVFIDFCKANNILRVPALIMTPYETIMGGLQSEGLVTLDKNNYTYSHQSIFDYFIARDMLVKLLNGDSIETVVGPIDKQTPWRRYQVQMMFEQLYDISSEKFLECGKILLEADEIRFYIKHVFFETIGHLENIDRDIADYVSLNFFDPVWGPYLEEAVRGNLFLVELLINKGIFESLIFEQEDFSKGLLLLQSVDCNESEICTKIIYKIYHQFPKAKSHIDTIFYKNCNRDCADFFNLRIDYYKSFWNSVSVYIDLEGLLQSDGPNFSRLIELIRIGVMYNSNVDFPYREYPELRISISCEQLEELIKVIPITLNRFVDKEWVANPLHMTYKRLLVELIKSALVDWCHNNEEFVWMLVERLMKQDNFVYKEIILFVSIYLSKDYSDKIFEYLYSDLKGNIFDYSSTKDTCLDMIKEVIVKHSETVNSQILNYFLAQVIKFIDKNHINYLHKLRIENIRESDLNFYESYWGAFQYIIFNSIDSKVLIDQYKAVKKMLNRKYPNGISLYNKLRVTSGFVNSSIPFNKLSNKAWRRLLCDRFIDNKEHKRISKKGLLIENTVSTISSAIANQIEAHTKQFLTLIISCGSCINRKYIEAAVVKLTDEQILFRISDIELLDFIKYILVTELDISLYARYLFEIIAKRPKLYLDNEVKIFVDKFFYKENIKFLSYLEPNSISTSDSFLIQELNTDKGRFVNLVCALINTGYLKFEDRKKHILTILSTNSDFDIYLYVKILTAEYCFNKSNGRVIVDLLLKHYNVISLEIGLSLLRDLYNIGYKEEVKEIVRKCYLSSDPDLIQLSSYYLAELYLWGDTSVIEYMNDSDTLMKCNRLTYMIDMVNIYFSYENHREKVKLWYINMLSQKLDISRGIAILFNRKLIDLQNDNDFIKLIFSTEVNRLMLGSFVRFLKDTNICLLEFSDIVIKIISCAVNHISEPERIYMCDYIDELLVDLYEVSYKSKKDDIQCICLDLWDIMYKNHLGNMRVIMDKAIR